ncbi:hypothetical protein [Prochlorococcus sp. MIT 0801]|uniref:hypothetical protein n=1 Tax=Prochlorococcus sp. MIT 0801 TaxID=1501269 RepID=UPI0004F91C05|nr:hypothetical protein [Prochlorococcus sp. MIT 0801]AIQ97328.1 hypothetical protein EW15_1236 [Prochlorococcus sp. MIT 0801]
MKYNSRYKLDLLWERRNKSSSTQLTFTNTKKLRKLGYYGGCFIAGIGILIFSLGLFHTYRRIKFKEKLALESKEYQVLKSKFELLKKEVNIIYSINNRIAKGIIGTRSGSSLLLELQRILPKTTQITSIRVKDNNLILTGKVKEPYGLDHINSFKVQISNSFLINDQSVFLSRISRSDQNKNNLNFLISSKFSNPSTSTILDNYESLKTYGLLKRVQLLKQEGLIK